MYGLHRTTLPAFPQAAVAASEGVVPRGGCVVAFRTGESDQEPFGMWFGWIVLAQQVFIVDLQNGVLTNSLEESIQALEWQEPPRTEIFYAVYR